MEHSYMVYKTIESDYIDIYIKLCAVTHEYTYRVVQVANFGVERPIMDIFCWCAFQLNSFDWYSVWQLVNCLLRKFQRGNCSIATSSACIHSVHAPSENTGKLILFFQCLLTDAYSVGSRGVQGEDLFDHCSTYWRIIWLFQRRNADDIMVCSSFVNYSAMDIDDIHASGKYGESATISRSFILVKYSTLITEFSI